ncbi:MAG: phenylacetate--CoA ligase family protein [Variibacter sp.]|nr:phenylacetate--CoA ligase family protein [Variibacter sp.]
MPAEAASGVMAIVDSAYLRDADALRALREARLAATVALCLEAHPFYRRRLKEAGVAPGDVRTLDDLQKLPLTHKADYMAAPEDFRLDAAIAGRPPIESTLWNIAYTTGTTSGRPSPFFNTTHDQYCIMLQARRCAEAEGFRRGDVLANLIPLPPMPTGGFLVVGRTAEAFGIPVVAALTGARNPDYPLHRGLDEAIDTVAAASPTLFWGIPSFVRRFFRRARERGVTFPRARLALVTGEPVSASLQAELAEHLRAFGATDPQVRMRYSCTEMQGGLVQSGNGAPLQNMAPDLYYLEVVDPDTGRRLPEGEEGALALTHLHRRGTVMLRYLVGDLIALKTARCARTGILGERVASAPRRTGALFKIKGMLVNPELIFEALNSDRGIREYQLVVRKSDPADPESMDDLVVRIEAEPDVQDRLARDVPALVQKIVMVRPAIEFAAPGEIHDPLKAIKARRIVDERGR